MVQPECSIVNEGTVLQVVWQQPSVHSEQSLEERYDTQMDELTLAMADKDASKEDRINARRKYDRLSNRQTAELKLMEEKKNQYKDSFGMCFFRVPLPEQCDDELVRCDVTGSAPPVGFLLELELRVVKKETYKDKKKTAEVAVTPTPSS